MNVENRIVGLAEEDPAQLLAHPLNHRRHGGKQLEALRSSLRRVGWVAPVIVNDVTGYVLDGHARIEEAMRQGVKVPVLHVEISEEQEREQLANHDYIGDLGFSETDALRSLLTDIPLPKDDDATVAMLTRVKNDEPMLNSDGDSFLPRKVAIDKLKEHPRNYRKHPEDQLQQIMASIQAHGFYRNVVVAKDYTILAGHGIVLAAKRLGKTKVPVIKLDLEPDDVRALKVLTSDNEISRLAETDDRALTELLKEILHSQQDGLLGTGFNEEQLAALAMVTRPASELKDFDAAAEWLGMPEYEEGGTPIKLVITFPNEDERKRFVDLYEIRLDKNAIKGSTYSTRWPWTDREDGASIKFGGAEVTPGQADG